MTAVFATRRDRVKMVLFRSFGAYLEDLCFPKSFLVWSGVTP